MYIEEPIENLDELDEEIKEINALLEDLYIEEDASLYLKKCNINDDRRKNIDYFK